MQRDETGTMTLVKTDFARMKELSAKHGGEVLNTMGDGMLLCFASAVQAVTYSLQIQAEFALRRTMKPSDQALEHRIGIHVGEVFRQDGQVAGDGVNIAARLQTRAPAGGICVSQTAYNLIKGKITVQAIPFGPQEFKNIAEKIPVYQLMLPVGAAPGGPPSARTARRKWVIGAAAVAVAIAASVPFWPKQGTGPAAIQPEPAAPAKSIAVLPFINMSADKDNAFFTDGVQDDILTSLANVGDLLVISRTSVIQYRDTTKTIRQIGKELGVAYVLEGSVERAGDAVHVTGQLIDAHTEGHVWAQHYDRAISLKDVFAVQSAIAEEIVAALKVKISSQEKSRLERAPTTSTTAYDLYLQGRGILNGSDRSLEALTHAEALFQNAVVLDSAFAAAWGELASIQAPMYYRDASSVHKEKARKAIETMERLAPNEPDTWLKLAVYYLAVYARDYARSDSYLQRAAQALPNNGTVALLQAEADRRNGRAADVLVHYRKAYEVDPLNDNVRRILIEWLLDIRHYEDVTTLERHDPHSDGYALALLPFYERGSTKEMDDWFAAHPGARPEALIDWQITSGNAAEYVRLTDEARRKQTPGNPRYGGEYIDALMALGETARARELTGELQVRIKAEQGNDATDPLLLAALGDKQAALAALEAAQAADRKAGINRDLLRGGWEPAFILAKVGEKDRAVAEFARLLKLPCGLNVYILRHNWALKSLQGYPPFEALLNEPKNNAPLF